MGKGRDIRLPQHPRGNQESIVRSERPGVKSGLQERMGHILLHNWRTSAADGSLGGK